MKRRVVTLSQISSDEQNLVESAFQRYGDIYKNVLGVYNLIENFFVKYLLISEGGLDLFLRFFYAARNSYLLATFSIVRLHHFVKYSFCCTSFLSGQA